MLVPKTMMIKTPHHNGYHWLRTLIPVMILFGRQVPQSHEEQYILWEK